MHSLLPFLTCWLPIAAGASVHDATGFIFEYDASGQRELGVQVGVNDLRRFIDGKLRGPLSPLGRIDETIIRSYDQLNGGQSRILNGLNSEPATQVLITWEGASLDHSIADVASYSTYFEVSNGAASFDDLFAGSLLSPQGDGKASSSCHYEFQAKEGQDVRLKFDAGDDKCPSGDDLVPTDSSISLEDLIHLVVPRISAKAQSALISIREQSEKKIDTQAVSNVFSALSDLASKSKQQTILLCSQTTRGKNQKRRFEPTEQRLSDVISSDHFKDTSSVQDMPKTSPKQIPKPGMKMPSTIMPLCYASNSTCNDVTQNCSGHGYCYQKSSSKNSVGNKDCFACKCLKTVVSRYADGRPKKTIQWGGPACQKKDVSTPFFIFTILTIIVVLAITGGVRLLFRMGQEELPSVLSAGVAAKAQK
ncbi:hypothetical protein KEM56_006935 [Ascosphaera pollenicola]|nr:hypothetical protein KEM56_006935 [Ascosphaera pollenicola]